MLSGLRFEAIINVCPITRRTAMKMKVFGGLALALSVSCIGMMIATDALALPDHGYRIIYFDAPGGNVVGHESLSCSGAHHSDGIATEYYTETDFDCPVGG